MDMDRDTDREMDRDMDRDKDRDHNFFADEATLSIDVEKMEAMKRLFASKRGNRSDEATLSLLNVKF